MPFLLATIMALLIGVAVDAHPGKTDRHGGHRCLKECAEWDLYYGEYHLHDKYGKPIRVAAKKKVRKNLEAPLSAPASEPAPEAVPVPVSPVVQRPAIAAVALEEDPCRSSLLWSLLAVLLFWLLVRRRRAVE